MWLDCNLRTASDLPQGASLGGLCWDVKRFQLCITLEACAGAILKSTSSDICTYEPPIRSLC